MKPLLLLFAASLTFVLPSRAQERMADGAFDGLAPGVIPPNPWIIPGSVRNQDGVSVTLAPLPASSDERLWIHLRDENENAPATFLRNFEATEKGRLSLKLHFDRVGTAFGIYLGPPKVSGSMRVIDVKILSQGVLSTGHFGDREKVGFKFVSGTTYDLVIDFERQGPKVVYQVKLVDGEVLAESEIETDLEIAGLRIASDRKDKLTDVYISDISLVAEE